MDSTCPIKKIIIEYKIEKINDIINYVELQTLKNNLKLNENIKDKENFKQYLFSDNDFHFDKFTSYYINKFNTYKFTDYRNITDHNNYTFKSVHDETFKKLIMDNYICYEQYNILHSFLSYFHKKYIHIIYNLINIDFNIINNYSILKKILATIYFKNNNNKIVYSLYKQFKSIFYKKITLLKQINNTHKLFDKEFNFPKYYYHNDKKYSSGENIIFEKLLHIYKTHPHLLVFFSEYILPIKFIKNLRADFLCLIVDKNNTIRKVIIEINGEQHYKYNTFFNDKNLQKRDNIKKEFCKNNNIIFLVFDYDQVNQFDSIFNELLLSI
jgi:hypothetical protein